MEGAHSVLALQQVGEVWVGWKVEPQDDVIVQHTGTLKRNTHNHSHMHTHTCTHAHAHTHTPQDARCCCQSTVWSQSCTMEESKVV